LPETDPFKAVGPRRQGELGDVRVEQHGEVLAGRERGARTLTEVDLGAVLHDHRLELRRPEVRNRRQQILPVRQREAGGDLDDGGRLRDVRRELLVADRPAAAGDPVSRVEVAGFNRATPSAPADRGAAEHAEAAAVQAEVGPTNVETLIQALMAQLRVIAATLDETYAPAIAAQPLGERDPGHTAADDRHVEMKRRTGLNPLSIPEHTQTL
jgi:hypothetical protein